MKRNPVRWFFRLVFLITWGTGLVGLATGGLGPRSPLFYIAVWSPTITAFLLTYLLEGTEGVLRLAKSASPALRDVPLYAAVLLVYPNVLLVGAGIKGITLMPPFHLFYPALAAGILRDPGPLGEEFGWRGFALPRLSEIQTFLRANLIIGFFWAVWHLPTFFIPALPQAELSIVLFFVSTMALAIIAGWITRAAQGRILPAILLHAVANAAAMHLPTSQLTNAIAHVVIAALLLFWRPAEPLPRVTPES